LKQASPCGPAVCSKELNLPTTQTADTWEQQKHNKRSISHFNYQKYLEIWELETGAHPQHTTYTGSPWKEKQDRSDDNHVRFTN